MIDRDRLANQVRAHATKYYERNGWDYLVECWSNADIIEAMGKARTLHAAIRNCRQTCMMLDERRREVQAEAY